MVNEVPCEVPCPKTREACGPSGFSLGTSLGSPFTMNPLGFSTNCTLYIRVQVSRREDMEEDPQNVWRWGELLYTVPTPTLQVIPHPHNSLREGYQQKNQRKV